MDAHAETKMFFKHLQRGKTARGLVGSFFNRGMKKILKDEKITAKQLIKFLTPLFSSEDDEMVSHTTWSS